MPSRLEELRAKYPDEPDQADNLLDDLLVIANQNIPWNENVYQIRWTTDPRTYARVIDTF